MKIAVDAMGGDYAPAEIVKGAVQGSKAYGVDVILVGNESAIKRYLPADSTALKNITIRHTSEAIRMDEHAAAVRTKKDASVVVAASLVKEHEADAMVSVGNTAAAMAIATLKIGRIRGIDRPAIATPMPSRCGVTILLDAGAVVDCTVDNLEQFAIMGSIYAERVLSISKPRVGLLSVGEEKSKGNEVTRAAHEAMESLPINFIGNVEGRHVFNGDADVVVADGFVGNVVLKTAEGLGEYIRQVIIDDLRKHPLTWLPVAALLPLFRRLRKKVDYSAYGGAPLLGIDGVCIIGHGRSNARAVANAVRAAKEAVSSGVVAAISDTLASQQNKFVRL